MNHDIELSGIVGMDITLDSIRAALGTVPTEKDTILFKVNSPGGSVTDGFEIYNYIKNLKARKVFEITGMSMSIMSLIMLAGDEIISSPVSIIMIHKASLGIEGNSDVLKQNAEILDSIDSILVETYFTRNQLHGEVKLTKEEILEMLKNETWMSPNEAKALGFIDSVGQQTEAVKKAAAQFNKFLTNPNLKMNYLEKIKKFLAEGNRPVIKAEVVKEAYINALGEQKIVDLDEQQAVALKDAVVAAIQEIVGGDTLTAEESTMVQEVIAQTIAEITEKQAEEEEAPSANEELLAAITQLTDRMTALEQNVHAVAGASVETAEAMETLSGEITAMKKGVRTFAKKPFTNESVKGKSAGQYVDPYAKHRESMKEIEKKTRIV